MAKFTLTIDCDGAAFDGLCGPAPNPEIIRILRGVIKELDLLGGRAEYRAFLLRDTNGNRVGEWRITDGEG